MKNQGKNMSVLQDVIDTLLMEKPLDIKHHDHPLSGKYIGLRECHITPDWLLIYAADHKQLILTAIVPEPITICLKSKSSDNCQDMYLII